MNVEKHNEALLEVYKTISEALNDTNGLLSHQRRIALITSLGMQQLIELYFHKLSVIKPGTQIKHEWFKLEEENRLRKLGAVLTKSIRQIPRMDEILFLAHQIEVDRNDLAYEATLSEDKKLKEKIDVFLELKNIVQSEIGD